MADIIQAGIWSIVYSWILTDVRQASWRSLCLWNWNLFLQIGPEGGIQGSGLKCFLMLIKLSKRWQVSRLLLCSGEAQVWVGLRVLRCSWGSSGLQNLDMKLVGSDQWAQMRKPKKLLSSWILFLSASKIDNYWLENTLEHWGCEKSFIKADLLLIIFSIVNINIQLQTVTKIVL